MFIHGRIMVSWCLIALSFTLFIHPHTAFGATTDEGQVNLWMSYDSLLDDQEKFAYTSSELNAVQRELELLNELVAMRQKEFDQNVINKEVLLDYQAQRARAEAKLHALEHRTTFYKTGSDIAEHMMHWYDGADLDLTKIQRLYWNRWKARCDGLAYTKAESMTRRDFLDWRLAMLTSLEQQRASTREEKMRVETELYSVNARVAAIAQLQEGCKNGPPFPSIADFSHLKVTRTKP